MLTIEFADDRAQRRVIALREGMTEKATNPVIQRVAMRTLKAVVTKTPKGYTGQTRRDWHVYKRSGPGGSGYLVTNQSKVMFFLERGTKAHGPKTKKFLYIPLNRKAAIGGWNSRLVIGEDYILTKRVKGIKAMNIVKKQIPISLDWTQQAMRQHVKGLLTGG